MASGLSVLLAIVLVVFAVTYTFKTFAIDRPGSTRTFATESGGASS